MEAAREAPQRIGCDTGFFVELLRRQDLPREVWETVRSGEAEAAVCCLSYYELRKLGLRGEIGQERVERLIRIIEKTCRVLWLSDPLLDRAARISHGNGLATADAIILSSLLSVGVKAVYTTDSDFEKYAASDAPEIVQI